jgi:hypothetical protein
MSNPLTDGHSLLEKSPLHRVARERQRRSEVLPCNFRPAAAKLEFAKCRKEEGICREAIAVLNAQNLFEPTFGSFVLRDGDCAVERNYRG